MIPYHALVHYDTFGETVLTLKNTAIEILMTCLNSVSACHSRIGMSERILTHNVIIALNLKFAISEIHLV